MNHLATAAAPRPKADAWFFPVMTAVVWLGVIMGFGGEMVRQSRAGDLTYPLIVHIHALVFTGWLVVFTAQVVFIRQGRFGLHRTLGLAAMAASWSAAAWPGAAWCAVIAPRLTLTTNCLIVSV